MAGILMIAVQALEKRSSDQTEENTKLQAENADLKARLERLERTVGAYALAEKAE
jgi:regulator of replication initiation timing